MNTSINKLNSTSVIQNNKTFHLLTWSLISIIFILTITVNSLSLDNLDVLLRSLITLGICAVAWLHGTKRYGVKNMVVFFVITWIVSSSFEALSIRTGFPFGNYHYTIPGPRILEVPLIIMPGYFGMGYMAWVLSHILNGQYNKRIQGIQIFFVPLVASFIMVMWDIVMDPIAATINKAWIWQNGGTYFGVPISNYWGWFFVVFVFLQIFAIFVSNYDIRESENNFNKLFWFEATAVYGIQGLSYLLQSITGSGNKEIYSSIGLISVFTMIFVTILSAISICNSNEFSYVKNKTNSIPKNSSVKEQLSNTINIQ